MGRLRVICGVRGTGSLDEPVCMILIPRGFLASFQFRDVSFRGMCIRDSVRQYPLNLAKPLSSPRPLYP